MKKTIMLMSIVFLVSFAVLTLTGCTVIFQKGRPAHAQKISQLQKELSELERAKLELEDLLKREISDSEVKVEMLEKGLVITFVNEVLFDSGKAELKSNALSTLSDVARVLKTTVRDLNVGIEGHTDNIPIKYSKWKSNWELSAARALSVLHFLADTEGISPDRLSATGYGEYHPVTSNDTKAGRQQNRRVEIVILPKTIKEKAILEKQNLK
ncbi:MAG: OmpA family protein [Candidatus Omnitrophota bacterium]